ncbi:hypothetical protein BCR42DRAFT_424319 [Absidia repens]|uniref:F-box domain-containing protein n=1 Tax=Absidia repens TaxID=90262 RepID=A0A1X2I429_9FUNG|nr:hypothetical protein BCR42DRAFT_424319 [Absidia repens]
MDRLSNLPSETLWQILSYLNVHDLSCMRLSSKKMALFADHPSHWRHLDLAPLTRPCTENSDQKGIPISPLQLWNLKDLQRLIGPHRRMIKSIRIWGVRDNIVRYILSHCVNLTDLTLNGWSTLSEHAFKHIHPHLKLHRLMLVGAQTQPNYTSMDATTLAHLLMQCPLKELSLGCQVHIHAQTLLMELNKRQHKPLPSSASAEIATEKSSPSPLPPKKHKEEPSTYNKGSSSHISDDRLGGKGSSSLQLERLTLATRRTWSTEHVMALFDTCPSLYHVCLFPTVAAGGYDQTAQAKKMDSQSQQQQMDGDNGVADMMIHRSTERAVEQLL